ncbi:MAG TPA: IS21 family transposase, partial [Accumulibacter sp.]|nr:IS21 family transposase [Accumulibacter sp.]
YRARTKGKVERFNGYLRRSFYVPLVAKLKQAGLQLDVVTANIEVRHWLKEVANVRLHGTTQRQPSEQLQQERAHLQAIPAAWRGDIAAARPLAATPTPSDQNKTRPATVAECIAASLPAQHPLAVYEQLLEAWRTDVAVMQ